MGTRINRISFITGIIASIVGIAVAALIIDGVIAVIKPPEPTKNTVEGIALLIFAVMLTIIWFMLSLKRARDIGKYVPLLTASFFISFIGMVLLPLLPGEKQNNKYGLNPPRGIHF